MRLLAMLVKELVQTLRDKRSRFLLIGPPLIQMLIFGYAATLELHHVDTAILDRDHSPASRDLAARLAASRYFRVDATLADEAALRARIDAGDDTLAVEIPAGFGRHVARADGAALLVVVDAANSNTALIALGYVGAIAERYAADAARAHALALSPSLAAAIPQITVEERPWYNAGLSSRWFFVPGVIGNLILIMVTVLTAFAVVREREIGTLEQIMVTPIRRWEFIVGKTLPFFVIGLVDAALISLVGTLWFGVPFRGSLAVFALGTVAFLLCTLAVGLLVSTVSRTQQQALVAAFFFNMPAVIFSGFGTPIASMPKALQWISRFDPLRYYLVVLRGVYLKGVGLEVLGAPIATLAVMGTILVAASVLRFRKSLD